MPMVQQTIDPKVGAYGLRNPENSSPSCEKQLPAAVKKTPLRDIQNDNRVVPNSNVNSPYTKDVGPAIDAIKVSGAKRPPAWMSPSQDQSSSSNSPNAHLVYVRRKSEVELGKSSPCDGIAINTNSNSPHVRQVDSLDETNQSKPQIKEPKVSCFSAFAPLPKVSLLSSPGKASVPLSVGKSGVMLPPESNHHPVASDTTLLNSSEEVNKLHWEERYCQLQMLLKKLDQSNQDDFVQMLQSYSSVELSELAVELEKRSIQLSLEEAKEMHRVALLNILGKTMKNVKAL